MFSEIQLRLTPPLSIHLLLQKHVGVAPHNHEFFCFKQEFYSGQMEVGKVDTNVLLEHLKPADSHLCHTFFCKFCFVSLQIFQKPSPFSPVVEGGEGAVDCPASKVHHFHWEELASSVSEADPQVVLSKSTVTCCKCEYSLTLTFKNPPLSSSTIQKLRLVSDIGESYLNSLQLISSILLTALSTGPKSLKMTADAFKRTFKNKQTAVAFFETIGYNSDKDLLIPDPTFWPAKPMVALSWAQLQLERNNHIALLELNNDPQRSFFNPGHSLLTKLFGGTYCKDPRYGSTDPFNLSPHDLTSIYAKLGCVRDMPDGMIWEVFRTLQGETPHQSPIFFDHMIEIAESRNSEFLLGEIALAKSQGEYSLKDVKKALQHFELPENTNEIDEGEVLSRYQMLTMMNPNEAGEHRTNLKLLAMVFASKEIEGYLETGQLLNRSNEHRPIGLDNIGNTCYLNSLLQYFFSVKYLRKHVISSSSKIEVLDYDMDEECDWIEIDNRKVDKRDIILARFFVKHLCDLFTQLESEQTSSYISPSLELAKMALGNMDVFKSDPQPAYLSLNRRLSFYSLQTNKDNLTPPPGDLLIKFSPPTEKTLLIEDIGDVFHLDSKLVSKLVSKEHNLQRDVDTQGKDPGLLEQENILKRNRSTSIEHMLDIQPMEDDLLAKECPLASANDSVMGSPSGSNKDYRNDLLVDCRSPSRSPSLCENKSRALSPFNELQFGSQQDVSECMDHIMWQLEKAFVSQSLSMNTETMSDSGNIIKDLFYGKTRQTLKYTDANTCKQINSTKEEAFSQLMINVDKPSDIYQALDEYFSDSLVELEAVEATRELSIDAIPPFLQIQFQRVQFNRETLQVYKSNVFLKLYEHIYLDRYLSREKLTPESLAGITAFEEEVVGLKDASDSSIDLEAIALKKKLCLDLILNFKEKVSVLKLNNSEMNEQVDLIDLQKPTSEYTKLIHTIEILEEKLQDLEEGRESSIKNEVEVKEKIKCLFAKHLKLEYSLHAVFIHKGTADYGHYWVYIRNWVDANWFKYDDETVTLVEESEIYADTSGSIANPYYVIYVDSSRVDELLKGRNSV